MKKPSDTRFGSFFDRVEVERAALKIINDAVPGVPLHGLSQAAIDSWRTAHVQPESSVASAMQEIAKILYRLSARIGALADQSRVVFSGQRTFFLPTDEVMKELAAAAQLAAPAAKK